MYTLNSCVKRHVWLNIHTRADLLRLVPAIRTDAFARLLASLCASACLDISDCHWTLLVSSTPPSRESSLEKPIRSLPSFPLRSGCLALPVALRHLSREDVTEPELLYRLVVYRKGIAIFT